MELSPRRYHYLFPVVESSLGAVENNIGRAKRAGFLACTMCKQYLVYALTWPQGGVNCTKIVFSVMLAKGLHMFEQVKLHWHRRCARLRPENGERKIYCE